MAAARLNPRTTTDKHLVLIVDDELVNREILKFVLEEEYETITTADGESALSLIRQYAASLSLVLLDLLMPGMHGLEVLRTIQDDPDLKHIPVIVLTADQEAEVESLRAGAVDFLSKPYPDREIILARVHRVIEMTESREIIEFTERDGLTGLLNKEYFYRYAIQIDLHHADRPMDAILVDICHFRMINERYGKAFGDEILRKLGESLRDAVREGGGIVCRRDADTFLVYCPHLENYQSLLDTVSRSLPLQGSGSRVRLRMGIYADTDKSIDIERRFDRAKMAADTVIGSYRSTFAMYDSELHKSEVFAESLLESFDTAIREKQFKVFFQPKFNVRPDRPVLASAEALVRWIHPDYGFISPGQFIPLFEENGLIRRLDEYVWRETAAQIRDWKNRLSLSVPVSVNVSRVDMYDPELTGTLLNLIRENNLTPEDMFLEITESAYTGDSTQMIEKVHQLRNLGFHIEMDDFGTGYSSLNMISELPIDALKLDMVFIRTAFAEGGSTRLIEIIIDIADYLSVPVIAEGVETEEQMSALRAMGCDLVQGYYFSRPVPPEEFERFIAEKKKRLAEEGEEAVYSRAEETGKTKIPQSRNEQQPAEPGSKAGTAQYGAYFSIAQALASDFESIYYVDSITDNYTEFIARGGYEDLKIKLTGTDFFTESVENIPKVVFPDDQQKLLGIIDKKSILQTLEQRQAVSVEYRLMIENDPVWYRLKIVLAENQRYLVFGLSNVDVEIRRAEALKASQADSVTFASIAKALAADYFSIYYVDTETDHFIEYSSHDDYDALGIEKSGEDFFTLSRINIARVVHPEDQDKILQEFTREKLLDELDRNGTFTLNYRLMFGEKTNYVSMKATRMADKNDKHIVIGVNNINAQMQRQMNYDTSHGNKINL